MNRLTYDGLTWNVDQLESDWIRLGCSMMELWWVKERGHGRQCKRMLSLLPGLSCDHPSKHSPSSQTNGVSWLRTVNLQTARQTTSSPESLLCGIGYKIRHSWQIRLYFSKSQILRKLNQDSKTICKGVIILRPEGNFNNWCGAVTVRESLTSVGKRRRITLQCGSKGSGWFFRESGQEHAGDKWLLVHLCRSVILSPCGLSMCS